MGCICTKAAPPEDQPQLHYQKTTTNGHVSGPPSRRMDFIVTDSRTASRNDPMGPLKEKTAVADVVPQRRESAHQKSATVDYGGGERKKETKVSGPLANGVEAELVAAGWPGWLAAVAPEAVKGWLPRKAKSFEKLYKIGQGTYSSVYKARDLDTGMVVALKKVRFVNMDPESVRFMAREISILRKIDHPNIVKLEGLITSKNASSLYLVFEYMEHDLAGLSANPSIKFTEPQIKCYMKQLLNGLEHCHGQGILHRDIKGANLLIDNKGRLRIGDFGLATVVDPAQEQPLTSRVVTLWYRPPELLLGSTYYDFTVDLWSSGCILAELLAGKPIMAGRTEVEQLHKIFKLCGSPSEDYWKKSKLPNAIVFKPQHPYRRCLLQTYKDFPPSALALLDVLLSIEPEKRGTASSALKSEFFTTKPYACDPSDFPKFPASKEFDAKLREEECARNKEVATKDVGSESMRRGPREFNPMEANKLGEQGSSFQKPQRRLNTRRMSISESCSPEDDLRSRLPFDRPQRTSRNRVPHSGQLDLPRPSIGIHDRSASTLLELNDPQRRMQQLYGPSGGGKGGSKSHRSNNSYWEDNLFRFNQLDDGEVSEKSDWWPSSSIVKEERNHSKDLGPRSRKNKIQYSGPLMPPGGNLEEMLKEHERHIQQAVRKARLEKELSRKNTNEKGQFKASQYPG